MLINGNPFLKTKNKGRDEDENDQIIASSTQLPYKKSLSK
jgi:hypothetical protein